MQCLEKVPTLLVNKVPVVVVFNPYPANVENMVIS